MLGVDRQRVRLEPHQANWQKCYEDEIERLSSIVDEQVRFEHVGSTAITGVPAKPIIDILALVEALDTTATLTKRLEEAGYEFRPDDQERLFFAKGPSSARTHYLHVAEETSEYATEMLVFRDHLRSNPAVASLYTDLKQSLASRFPENREAYTRHKGEFVESVLDDLLEC